MSMRVKYLSIVVPAVLLEVVHCYIPCYANLRCVISIFIIRTAKDSSPPDPGEIHTSGKIYICVLFPARYSQFTGRECLAQPSLCCKSVLNRGADWVKERY